MKTKLQGDWFGKSPYGSNITISFEDSIMAGFPWWLDDAKYWIKKDTLYLKYLTMLGTQYQDTTYKIIITKLTKDSLIFLNYGPSFPLNTNFLYSLSKSSVKYDSTINVKKVCFNFSPGFSNLSGKYIEVSNAGDYISFSRNVINKGKIPNHIFTLLQDKIRKCNLKDLDSYYYENVTCVGTNALTVIYNDNVRKSIYMHYVKPQELDMVMSAIMRLEKYATYTKDSIKTYKEAGEIFTKYITASFPEYDSLTGRRGIPKPTPSNKANSN